MEGKRSEPDGQQELEKKKSICNLSPSVKPSSRKRSVTTPQVTTPGPKTTALRKTVSSKFSTPRSTGQGGLGSTTPLRSTPYSRTPASGGWRRTTPRIEASHVPIEEQAVRLEKEIESTRTDIEDLDAKLSALTKYSVKDYDNHIRLLHVYNETRDMGQELLAMICQMEGSTSKEVYDKFGLDGED